jgi:hypothetical protein
MFHGLSPFDRIYLENRFVQPGKVVTSDIRGEDII